jgi:hypothetical protein
MPNRTVSFNAGINEVYRPLPLFGPEKKAEPPRQQSSYGTRKSPTYA